MAGGEVRTRASGAETKLRVERELLPVGPWRRWIVHDPGANGRRLLLSLLEARRAAGLDIELEQLADRAREASRLVHPGLSRVVEVGVGQVGVWTLEEVGEELPLSHCVSGDVPTGGALTRGLVRVIDAIAYIRRHGLAHGAVSADTVFCHPGGLRLTGVALWVPGQDGVFGVGAENVRGWGQVGRQLLAQRPGAMRGGHPMVQPVAAAAEAGEPGAPSDGPQMAALVREALAAARGGSERQTAAVPAADEGNAKMTLLRSLGYALRGLLTTVLTIALIVAAVTAGVLWALARGPAEISVPNLIGMTRTEAGRRLTSAGLSEARVREVYRDDIAAGRVADTVPPVGMRVRQGRQVSLVLSLGSAQVTVPKLVGLQLAEAEGVVRGKGLKLREDARRRSAAPVGEIVGQEPAPGERVGRAAEVGVTVSGGEDYGTLRVLGRDGEEKEVLFRRIEIIVPQGEPVQQVKVREGYRDDLRVTYERVHRPGERVTVDTYGFEGKRIEVEVEGATVFKTRL